MAEDFKLLAMVRGLIPDTSYPAGREDQQIHMTGQDEVLYAQGAAPYQEIVRMGRAFFVKNTTAVATVTSMPTTACTIAIYNNEPDGGRTLIIDEILTLITADATNFSSVTTIGCLSPVREAIPANSALVPVPLNSSTKLDTRARTIIGGTALPATTGFAGNWFPIGPSVNAAVTSLPGFQAVYPIDGRIEVMPGRYLGLHTFGTHTTTSAMIGIRWHEQYLTQG